MKIDRFILAIIVTIVIAYFFPAWGSAHSKVPIDIISSIGVSLIFFFYGLKLSFQSIRAGLANWKLHVLVQASTFVLFPLIVLATYPLFKHTEVYTLWLGILFLAALPSTVSSSVVMVSIAKGNIPAAIFNASISGLIGIAVTPIWMGIVLDNTATSFDLSGIYTKLLLEILAPVLLGVLLQRFGHQLVLRYNKQLALFDKTIILLIIYKSFAESFEEKIFSTVSLTALAGIFAAIVVLFYVVYGITGYLCKWLGFNDADTITARFCGTKKSLVHGTVFSKLLFPASIPAGLILLPLMLFHAFQLFVISAIAAKLANRPTIPKKL